MIATLREDVRRAHECGTPPGAVAAWLRSPGLRLLAVHRLAHRFERPRPAGWHRLLPFLAVKIVIVLARAAALVTTKSEITPDTPIDAGVVLADGGHIIAGARRIGGGTWIGERVTIGVDLRRERRPLIGREVWIGPRSVIYGDITVGDGATILPGTILSRSVPTGGVVSGNPGRVVEISGDHAALRRRLLATPAPGEPISAERVT